MWMKYCYCFTDQVDCVLHTSVYTVLNMHGFYQVYLKCLIALG